VISTFFIGYLLDRAEIALPCGPSGHYAPDPRSVHVGERGPADGTRGSDSFDVNQLQTVRGV
jgi:hypothetical protein